MSSKLIFLIQLDQIEAKNFYRTLTTMETFANHWEITNPPYKSTKTCHNPKIPLKTLFLQVNAKTITQLYIAKTRLNMAKIPESIWNEAKISSRQFEIAMPKAHHLSEVGISDNVEWLNCALWGLEMVENYHRKSK